MIGVLVTDGGPHKSEKWAEATASHIVDIADHVSGARRSAAIKLQAAIIDILIGHHRACKHGERGRLEDFGGARLSEDCDPNEHLPDDVGAVADEIIAAAKSTEFGTAFNAPYIRDMLIALLTSHFKTNMHIERSWHADRNPDCPHSQAYLATHNIAEG